MSKYFSIPGCNADGSRHRDFHASRKKNAGTASGFTPGDEVMMHGDPAVVLHEEHDQHTGETHTYVQRSVRGQAGIYRVAWERSGENSMVIKEAKRTHG